MVENIKRKLGAILIILLFVGLVFVTITLAKQLAGSDGDPNDYDCVSDEKNSPLCCKIPYEPGSSSEISNGDNGDPDDFSIY